MTRPTILLLLVFVAGGSCLPSCCLAVKGGIHFTEPLPSKNGRVYEVRRYDGLNCHDIRTKFYKDWSGIQKLIGADTQTHTGWRLHKPTLGK
jgi:hypothetical protein